MISETREQLRILKKPHSLNGQKTMDSVNPPTKYLTFGPWIYMVPQYKPKNILILGYAGGTVAGLVRLLYGDVPITGVDIKPCEDIYGVNFIQADAKEYVKTCEEFDSVIVDVFANDHVCDFVLTEEFVKDLARVGTYIIVNTLKDPDMSVYKELDAVAMITPPGLENRIYYYERKDKVFGDLMPFENDK